MPAAELDALPPAEVAALLRAWQLREARLDARAGVLAAAMGGGRPADYFPGLAEFEPQPTDEELARRLSAVMGSLGG